MNYKKLAEGEFTELLKNNPEYSFGNTLYDVLRLIEGANKLTVSDFKSKIRDMKDEDMYTLIYEANIASGPEIPFED